MNGAVEYFRSSFFLGALQHYLRLCSGSRSTKSIRRRGAELSKLIERSLVLALFCLLVVSLTNAQTSTNAVQQHLKLAQEALKSNNADVAVRELQSVIKLDPKNVEAHANLGVLLFFRHNCEEASKHFETALSAQPLLAKAEALLGICDKQLNKPSASTRLERAFAKLEEPELRTQVGLELAGLYHERGDLTRAAAVTQQLVALNPENVEILYMAHRIYAELSDDTLNKLAIVAPNSARMEQLIAQRLVNAGDLSGAIAHYRKAIELAPALPGVHYELAQAIIESGPSDPAKQRETENEVALALKTDGQTCRIESLLGRIALERSDVPSAFSHYRSAVQLSSSDTDAQLGLGRVLMAMQRWQDARVHLELAVESDPLNDQAHYRLAVTLRNLGRNDESEKEMLRYQEIKRTKEQVKGLYRQMNKGNSP